jgi:hypothetical protein
MQSPMVALRTIGARLAGPRPVFHGAVGVTHEEVREHMQSLFGNRWTVTSPSPGKYLATPPAGTNVGQVHVETIRVPAIRGHYYASVFMTSAGGGAQLYPLEHHCGPTALEAVRDLLGQAASAARDNFAPVGNDVPERDLPWHHGNPEDEERAAALQKHAQASAARALEAWEDGKSGSIYRPRAAPATPRGAGVRVPARTNGRDVLISYAASLGIPLR